jgi:hypothetical protein
MRVVSGMCSLYMGVFAGNIGWKAEDIQVASSGSR